MTEFKAFVVEQVGDDAIREERTLSVDDLPADEVTIRVEYSGVNYKDGLATIAGGKVARISPLIPGVDMAGEVVASLTPEIPVGSKVIAHAYGLGVDHHGGFAELARVPAGWVVPLPDGLTTREAMVLGTAGFTAALSIDALERHGVGPGDGPMLVTGATGGVGSAAVAMLATRGYEVVASTGKSDARDWLESLGAADVLPGEEITEAPPKPLASERWAGAIDPVGGATLPYVLRTLRYGGAVAASGNAGGIALETTVLPFILRGVALIGIDSAQTPIESRRALWSRLADDLRPPDLDRLVDAEIGLDELEPALDRILAGSMRGRTLIRLT